MSGRGDNLSPLTLNKYLYGIGNPGRFIDPDGREIWNAYTSALNAKVANKDPAQNDRLDREVAHQAHLRDLGFARGRAFAESVGQAIRSGFHRLTDAYAEFSADNSVHPGCPGCISDQEALENKNAARRAEAERSHPIAHGLGEMGGDAAAVLMAPELARGRGVRTEVPVAEPRRAVLVEGPDSSPRTLNINSGERRVSELLDDCCARCFGAGTLVMTADGLEPIESITVGQRVMAPKFRSSTPVLSSSQVPPCR